MIVSDIITDTLHATCVNLRVVSSDKQPVEHAELHVPHRDHHLERGEGRGRCPLEGPVNPLHFQGRRGSVRRLHGTILEPASAHGDWDADIDIALSSSSRLD